MSIAPDNGVEQSRQLDRLLRDTRRRLYAAAAASDHEVFGAILSLPDSQVDAMEQRLRKDVRSAELMHRRAVARLADPDTPLPFADAANYVPTRPERTADGAGYVTSSPGEDGRAAVGGSQYEAGYRADDTARARAFQRALPLPRLGEVGFTKGLPLTPPPVFHAQPEQVLVVYVPHWAAELGGQTAERLARRLPVPAQVVRAGARTVNPGPQMRVRSAQELSDLRADHPDSALVLVVADSSVASHRRNAARIVEACEVNATWVCVDARTDVAQLLRACHDLPGGLQVDALAAWHVWDADLPGAVLETGIPVGMIDGAPASEALWELVARDALDRLDRRGRRRL